MRVRTFLGLILCNLIWSANPLMGKVLLRDFQDVHVSWLRSSSALAGFLLFLAIRSGIPRLRDLGPGFLKPRSRRDAGWILGLGFFAFCFAPGFAMVGLQQSRAVDNALIIAMEPLATVLMAWLFLGEGLRGYHWLSFIGAIYGFSLLSGMSWERLQGSWDPHLMGNVLMLISLVGEAVYSVFARKLLGRYLPTQIFGTALAIGVLLLSLLVGFRAGLPDVSHLTLGSTFALIFLGPIGTTSTYLFWMLALSEASIPTLAVTLFVQPLAGSLWGYLGLGETLSVSQAWGGLLILVAVALPVLIESRTPSVARGSE